VNVKDYDQAVEEVDDKYYEFLFGGEKFSVRLNLNGGMVLSWMEGATSNRSMVDLLKMIFGDEDYKRLKDTRRPWSQYAMLINDIFEQLGGPGNPQPSPS
jgi:hypothetical protein